MSDAKKEAKIKQLMDESVKIHYKLINLWKDMDDKVKSVSKSLNVPKYLFYALKDFQYYRGLGWASENNPLELERGVKFKDRVSPIFIKLLKTVNICRQLNCLDLLDVYINTLKEYGIFIQINPHNDFVESFSENSIKQVYSVVEEMKALQKEICSLADILREEKSAESEALDYVKKKISEV